MAPRISLALAIHNHQPVGNFGWVLEDVHDHAYRPLLDALERHPGVRLSLHYSGPLLDWLRMERPEFVERLAGLVARGQVELLGGGWYEPVLVSLPERDRLGQLQRMATELEGTFGRRPTGAWLAERVWEPDIPTSLVAAGYSWTILDDSHFRAASVPEENLWGSYTTEDQGNRLTVFGTEQGLRYGIPFGTVEEVIEHLRGHATEDGDRIGMMGDDGEKFGAWPSTYEHCWGATRWVDRFFEALVANASWLTTVTPSDWIARHPPIGRVSIPTASYAEMGEWALPADEAIEYRRVLKAAIDEHRPEVRWLRGGFWRNFQVKYREVNDLHKQMLRVSDRVAAMPAGAQRELALDELYKGQSNDCYWHGLFGGIYISHMRLATHEHLIAAEDITDRVLGTRSGVLADLDLDGRDEVRLAAAGQVVTVKLDEGAGIGAWDIRAARHALCAVMRRRPEAYHEALRTAAADDSSTLQAVPASIHDVVQAKESGLGRLLHYDWYERRSGLVRLLDPAATTESAADGTARELGDFVDRPFELVALTSDRLVVGRTGRIATDAGESPIRVERSLEIGGGRLDPSLTIEASVTNLGDLPVDARLAIEFATTMLGGGGNPAAFHEIGGERTTHDATLTASNVATLAAGNQSIGIRVETHVSPAADAWISPIETISNSEAGFERVYQGSAVFLTWPVTLAPGASQTVRVEQRVTVEQDRAVRPVDAQPVESSRAVARPAGAAPA